MEMQRAKYFQDPRIICRYGLKCYQRNPLHQEKYKHPPKFKQEEKTTCSSTKQKKNDDKTCAVPVDNSGRNLNSIGPDVKIYEISKPDVEHHKKSSSMLDLIQDPRVLIKNVFLMEMPDDFFQFYDFCKSLNEKDPLNALNKAELTLVGPYDVLHGKFLTDHGISPDLCLTHWRYFRDPPGVQTVVKGDELTGYHIGYFRDDPNELPVCLAKNQAEKNGVFEPVGGNIFAAVYNYLKELQKSEDMFDKVFISKIYKSIEVQAKKMNLELTLKTNKMKLREKKIVTRTFNNLGLVVPYNKKTQLGYRKLPIDNKTLSDLLTKIETAEPKQKDKLLSELQPVFTYANIAADECDFGTGIELGLNILAHGIDCLNSTISQLLVSNYQFLNMDAFAKIAAAHMTHRRKGCNLSVLK